MIAIIIYICASSHQIVEARTASDLLEACGHKVISNWYEQPLGVETLVFNRLAGILSADLVVVLNSMNVDNGLKFFEVGYALGKAKLIFLIGGAENKATSFANDGIYASVEELADELKTW